MEEVDIHETTFCAGLSGLYEFNCMPIGLSNAGASFCHIIDMCLGDQQYITLLFYLNDICVFSSTIDDMLDRVALVFNCLKEFNLKIKSKKTYSFQSSVVFLDHILSKDGISPISEKVKKGQDWPIPKTMREVHSFLGLASYYCRLIPQFVKWTSPVHELIQAVMTKKKKCVGTKLPPLSQNLTTFQWGI